MTPTLRFETPQQEARLKDCAKRVLEHFNAPNRRVLCYFAEHDSVGLRMMYGQFVRGLHHPSDGRETLPDEVEQLFYEGNDLAFDNLVYLMGRTNARTESFVLTFAHELQHLHQFSTNYKPWLANCAMFDRWYDIEPGSNLKPWEMPMEYDAHLKSKRVAENELGAEGLGNYIDSQIVAEPGGKWEFLAGLPVNEQYDWLEQTKHLVTKYYVAIKRLNLKVDWEAVSQ